MMKCPYCNAEMEKGYFLNPKMAITWYPEDVHPPMTIFDEPEGSVKLTKIPSWRRARKEAYCCKSCRKIVIEY